MKRALVVTGSPRKGSNSKILAEAFARGARTSGYEVKFFDAVKNTVDGCIACKKCWSRGHPCVFEDGFNKFAGMMELSDVIVLATPVYWGTYPAQLKALVDKFFAYGITRTKVDIRENKKMFLLACGDGKKESAFRTIVALTKELAEFHKWEFAGAVTAPELVNEREILGTPALVEAEEMGMNI